MPFPGKGDVPDARGWRGSPGGEKPTTVRLSRKRGHGRDGGNLAEGTEARTGDRCRESRESLRRPGGRNHKPRAARGTGCGGGIPTASRLSGVSTGPHAAPPAGSMTRFVPCLPTGNPSCEPQDFAPGLQVHGRRVQGTGAWRCLSAEAASPGPVASVTQRFPVPLLPSSLLEGRPQHRLVTL